MRVVVDTNIWVSAFLTPHGFSNQLKFYWQANRFDVVTSVPLLAELSGVLARPRLQNKYGYSNLEIADYLRFIAQLSYLVTVSGSLNICRDPDDDIVLETAIVGQATHVISRDEDVTRDMDIASHLKTRNIEIMTVQRFINHLAS